MEQNQGKVRKAESKPEAVRGRGLTLNRRDSFSWSKGKRLQKLLHNADTRRIKCCHDLPAAWEASHQLRMREVRVAERMKEDPDP